MNNAISVTQISNYIKSIFMAEEMLINISVYGEISGLNFSRDIAYFNLKDENAILPCVCFDSNNFSSLFESNKVVVKGSPSYYVKGGRLNFNVVSVKPFGMGELYRKFLELKDKLQNEGLFDDNKKITLPKNIKRIGVATSPTGAVIHDIINVISRRDSNIDIVIAPCKVQGEDADLEICDAVKKLECANVDLIIIARGGGSFEDLNCFNSERLAYTIFDTKKFVLSAVGHETDFTICDFVADMRAPTPSAAAELVSYSKENKKQKLMDLSRKLIKSYSMYDGLNKNILYLYSELNDKIDKLLSYKKNNIKVFANRVVNQIKTFQYEFEYQFGMCNTSIISKNPMNLLKLGYAKIEKNNQVVSSINQINIFDDVNIFLADGDIVATVKDKGDRV